MPIDVSRDFPGWWMKRLFAKLEARRPAYAQLDAYFRCENGIPIAATKATREAYQRLMRLARTNFAELVVEAPRERMQVVGFRTAVDGDTTGDSRAWDIWQANALDSDSNLVHRSKLALGDAYVIVGDVDPELGVPLITGEDPREVVTIHDPRNRRRARAALKAFFDEDEGLELAYLYLPGEVLVATRRPTGDRNGVDSPVSWGDGAGWEWDADRFEDLDDKVVPVVRFPNRSDLFGRSQGEFEPHLSILDRINYTVLSRLEIATLQAFRQRAVRNVPTHTTETDDEGNDVDVEINYDDIFASDPGALWLLPEGAEIWESGQVDLGPIRQAVRDDVQDLAAVTRTPLFYLTAEGQNGSAEGASLAREGLIFKTGERITEASDPWEQVMALAFMFDGDQERADRSKLEVIYSPPERFSLAERYDAATKASAAGVPWRTVMTDVLQFTPTQVDRMESDRAADAMLNAALAVPTGQDAT